MGKQVFEIFQFKISRQIVYTFMGPSSILYQSLCTDV